MRAKVHEHSSVTLDIDNAAKAVLVVRHQITALVYLGRFLDDGDIEGTTRQGPSPRAGTRWFHLIHSTRIARVVTAMADSRWPVTSHYRYSAGRIGCRSLVMEPSLRAPPVCLAVSLASSGHLTS